MQMATRNHSVPCAFMGRRIVWHIAQVTRHPLQECDRAVDSPVVSRCQWTCSQGIRRIQLAQRKVAELQKIRQNHLTLPSEMGLEVLWAVSILPQSSSTSLCCVWHLSWRVARLVDFLSMHCIQTLRRLPLKFNKRGNKGETTYISSSVTPQEVRSIINALFMA